MNSFSFFRVQSGRQRAGDTIQTVKIYRGKYPHAALDKEPVQMLAEVACIAFSSLWRASTWYISETSART